MQVEIEIEKLKNVIEIYNQLIVIVIKNVFFCITDTTIPLLFQLDDGIWKVRNISTTTEFAVACERTLFEFCNSIQPTVGNTSAVQVDLGQDYVTYNLTCLDGYLYADGAKSKQWNCTCASSDDESTAFVNNTGPCLFETPGLCKLLFMHHRIFKFTTYVSMYLSTRTYHLITLPRNISNSI